jgi:dihydrofolate synthase / folylpolyglutamate synthase
VVGALNATPGASRGAAYRDALDYLFRRTTGATKFGLERTREVLSLLGNPHERLRSFHIAGTNGKGSVAATLEALLRARGLRVGKYTSPHLVDFGERIVVDGVPISGDEVVRFVERWTPDIEWLGATFFEATTALAFDHLARAGVDAAIIETGLGGRLDSTNVITPVVAGVTSIGLDHTEYLGDTKEAIAAEKAGIFKPGVPAVIGEPDRTIAASLARMAAERGANPVRVVVDEMRIKVLGIGADGTRFLVEKGGEAGIELKTPLAGRHQAANAAVALTMLDAAGPPFDVSLAEAARSFEDVWLPGRFQRHEKFIFDVAHNPDGAKVLARTLADVSPKRPLIVLLTVLGDKDWRGIMRSLAAVVDGFVLTTSPTAPVSRAWHPEEPLELARTSGWRAELILDFDAALARAMEWGETVVVTGSFHTVGDVMARLQVDPLRR